ncbi:hypothetical protein [Pseudomonas aeruginosa]|uniref:hypothetical protein n=1 Tax=Pseudomonas aeruginosa TaxID=287 RepID=UPI00296E6116|nr:hypothetical protein [Pseudomonas aeruginosa]
MIRPQDCEILQWRSFDDEAAFFALEPHGFAVHSTRGSWVTLMRKAHGTDKDTDGASRGAVRRTARVAACRAD